MLFKSISGTLSVWQGQETRGSYIASLAVRLFKIHICQLAEVFDQFGLLWIIRPVIGSVQVVKPLGEVITHFGIFFVQLPNVVPWLIGLIFSGHKAPVIATDVLQID